MASHVHEETFDASAEELFELLHTPSAIREWWSASRAIVIPKEGGVWAAAWGDDEDAPDYITTAMMSVFDPPRRLVFTDYAYESKAGPLPFDAAFVTEFIVEPAADGTILRVTQDGFPDTRGGQEFLQACETGWRDTFAGIRRYLSAR